MYKRQTKPYDGILQLLADLKASGKKTAVISNKYDEAVVQLCKDYFPELFDAARGERAGVPRKPAPDGIYSILEELGSVKEHAVYVGDSEVDMETAKNAGLVSVGVTWGFRDRELLEEKGADYIIAVSYTHLDVYKRQRYWFRNPSVPIAGVNSRREEGGRCSHSPLGNGEAGNCRLRRDHRSENGKWQIPIARSCFPKQGALRKDTFWFLNRK